MFSHQIFEASMSGLDDYHTAAPIPDRENGVTPATRMLTRLNSEAGLKLKTTLAWAAADVAAITMGAICIIDGGVVLGTLAIAIAGGAWAGFKDVKMRLNIANNGERVLVEETGSSNLKNEPRPTRRFDGPSFSGGSGGG
jgi:hypothetical protein